jgi:hypothetical protein
MSIEELQKLMREIVGGGGADFLQTMIRQSEAMPQIAHAAYLRAVARGNSAEISAAIKNWHESMKAAAAARDEFITQQEKLRELLPLAPVLDVLGSELQALRTRLLKLGELIAKAANPGDPELARKAIDAGVDEIFAQMSAIEQRMPKEIEAATVNL